MLAAAEQHDADRVVAARMARLAKLLHELRQLRVRARHEQHAQRPDPELVARRRRAGLFLIREHWLIVGARRGDLFVNEQELVLLRRARAWPVALLPALLDFDRVLDAPHAARTPLHAAPLAIQLLRAHAVLLVRSHPVCAVRGRGHAPLIPHVRGHRADDGQCLARAGRRLEQPRRAASHRVVQRVHQLRLRRVRRPREPIVARGRPCRWHVSRRLWSVAHTEVLDCWGGGRYWLHMGLCGAIELAPKPMHPRTAQSFRNVLK